MRQTILAAVVAGVLGGAIGGVLVVLLDDNGGLAAVIVKPAVSEAEPGRAARDPLSVGEAVARVIPGLVAVIVDLGVTPDPEGNLVQTELTGTGLVIDREGYILTSEHNIRAVSGDIEVVLPSGEVHRAVVVGSDIPFNDVAVLRVVRGGLTAVPIGSSSSLRQGDTVYAVGHALRQEEPTVTVGVVSQTDTRTLRDGGVLQEHLIQTDAALNQGNSGGALVNRAGEVVGLTSLVVRTTETGDIVHGIGFALQMDVILPIARQIISAGRYPRPDFGVVRQESVTEFAAEQLDLPTTTGSFLLEIRRDGPLAVAGLRPGDIVLSIDGLAITPELTYLNVLARLEPGVAVEVVYVQDDRERRVSVTPEARTS